MVNVYFIDIKTPLRVKLGGVFNRSFVLGAAGLQERYLGVV